MDELRSQNAALVARVSALETHNAELTEAATNYARKLQELEQPDYQTLLLQKQALIDRVAGLESHNAQLTESATEMAKKIQDKTDHDYQMIMVHQKILAGLKDADPSFSELYEHCKPHTMTSAERLYALYKSVEYLVKASIPGDIVETGVWLGGSCMLAAETLLRLGDRSRRILLFDTFEGHPRPDREKDVDIWGNRASEEWERQTAQHGAGKWGYASLEQVKANLAQTGYPSDKLVFVKGKVEETILANIPPQVALLRLDTDWYESTKASLDYLYPKLAPGGVLIIDDYGHYKGQKQAVDEYFAALGEHPLLHRIDYSCRVMLKRG